MVLKRKTLGLLVAAGAGAFAFLAAGSAFLQRIGVPWLLREADRRYGWHVEWDAVHTNFFSRISLDAPRVTTPIEARADRLSVYLRPWSLLTFSFHTEPMCEIVVDRPVVALHSTGSASAKTAGLRLPTALFSVRINDGALTWRQGDHDVDVRRIDGRASLTPLGLSGAFTANEREAGRLELKGDIKRGSHMAYRATVRAPKAPLAAMAGFFDADQRTGYWSGTAEFEGEIKGRLGKGRRRPDWKIAANVPAAAWHRSANAPDVGFEARVEATRDTIKIVRMKLADAVELRGTVKAPWKNPRIALEIQADRQDLGPVARAADISAFKDGWSRLTMKGTASGRLWSPAVKAHLEIAPGAGASYPALVGDVNGDGDGFSARMSASGGQISADGRYAPNGPPSLRVSANDIDLGSLGRTFGWGNVDGRLNAAVSNRSGAAGDWRGHFSLQGFRWGRASMPTEVRGFLFVNRHSIRARATDDILTLNAALNGSRVTLTELKLRFGPTASMSVSGGADLQSQTADMNIDATSLPPDVWPPLVAHFPDIDGSLTVAGSVTGAFRDPRLKLKMSFADLRFRSDGDKWSGSATVTGSARRFVMDDIVVNGGYRGRLVRRADATGARWDGDIRLEKASPSLLADVFSSTISVGGSVDGVANWAYGPAGLVFSSTAAWSLGHIGAFGFDRVSGAVLADRNHVKVSDALLIQGGRAVEGEGEAERNGAQWQLDTTVQLRRWGSPTFGLDGEVALSGAFDPRDGSYHASFTSPVLWLQDFTMEEAAGQISGDRHQIRLSASADPDVDASVFADFDRHTITGIVRGRGLPLRDSIGKLAPSLESDDLPQGNADFTLEVSGALDAPDVSLAVRTDDVRWRNERLSGQAALRVDGDTITVISAEAAIAAGGALSFAGKVHLGEDGAIDVTGTGKDVDLQAVFHLLRWPVRWRGRTDLQMRFSGQKEKRNVEVVFDGEHEGFGPFRDEGELSGRIVGQDGVWDLNGLRATSGDGYLALGPGSQLFIDRNGAGTLHLLGEARNLQAGVLTLFGGAELTGTWGAEGLDAPAGHRTLELEVFARRLWINQFVLDGNVTHMTVDNGEIRFSPVIGSGQQISGALTYRDFPALHVDRLRFLDAGVEKLFLDGDIGADHWNFQLNSRELDASVLRGLLDTTVPMSGPLDFKLRGRGSLARPLVEGPVEWQGGRLGPVPIDRLQADLHYRSGVLELKDLRAQRKNGYDLRGEVTIPTGEDSLLGKSSIQVKIENGDFRLLEDVWPSVSRARGAFSASLRIEPGKGAAGEFEADKIAIHSPYTPQLDHGVLKLRLTNDRLDVVDAHARIGRGTLVLRGGVDLVSGMPSKYDLTLKTEGEQGISIRVPELAIAPGPILGHFNLFQKKLAGISRGEPHIDLAINGPAGAPVVSGQILLENAVFTYPPARPRGGEGGGSGRGLAGGWLDHVTWDVTLLAGNRTWYQNELVDALVSGQLRFTGPTSNLSVSGRITTQQGAIVYSGNEFQLKDAELEIITDEEALSHGNKQTLVYLRATAEKDVFYTDGLSNNNQDTIVMVVDRSLLGEIQPRFYAKNNPGLNSQRALQLALGIPFGDQVDSNSLLPDQRARATEKDDTDKMLRLGLVQLLDSSLASPLARALARRTGLVDFIRVTYQEKDPLSPDTYVDPTVAGSNNSITQNQFLRYAKGTKVRFGRGLSRRLFADYSFRVDEYQQQIDLRHEIELAYHLHGNIYLRGITELDQQRTLGRPPDRRALIENQWRFGLPRRKKPTPSPAPGPSMPAVAPAAIPPAGKP